MDVTIVTLENRQNSNFKFQFGELDLLQSTVRVFWFGTDSASVTRTGHESHGVVLYQRRRCLDTHCTRGLFLRSDEV